MRSGSMVHSLKPEKVVNGADSFRISGGDPYLSTALHVSGLIRYLTPQPPHHSGTGHLGHCMNAPRNAKISSTERHDNSPHVITDDGFALPIRLLHLENDAAPIRQRLENVGGCILIHAHCLLAAGLKRGKSGIARRGGFAAHAPGNESDYQ
jgi:hypothetical protein